MGGADLRFGKAHRPQRQHPPNGHDDLANAVAGAAAELPELAEILLVEGLDVSITGFSAVEIDQLVVDFEKDASDPDDTIDPEWIPMFG